MIKRPTTKDIFAESLMELMAARPLDKISVREIVANTEFSSTTFYKNFSDKYDLVEYLLNNKLTVFSEVFETPYEFLWTSINSVAYFAERRDVARKIYADPESLAKLEGSLVELALSLARQWHGEEAVDEDFVFSTRLFIHGEMGMMEDAMRAGVDSPALLTYRLVKSAPPRYQELLCPDIEKYGAYIKEHGAMPDHPLA